MGGAPGIIVPWNLLRIEAPGTWYSSSIEDFVAMDAATIRAFWMY